MKRIVAGGLLLSGVVVLSGCSIRHEVAKDYPQYLINNQNIVLPTTHTVSEYAIKPATKAYTYQFRSALAGYANVWVVGFGQILQDTLQSREVQTAFGSLRESSSPNTAADLLAFDLQSYTFSDFGAHVVLNVSLNQAGVQTFAKTYQADGETQGGKMFWAGAFGMKNAVQQSTKLAIDKIFIQLINDLNSIMANVRNTQSVEPGSAPAIALKPTTNTNIAQQVLAAQRVSVTQGCGDVNATENGSYKATCPAGTLIIQCKGDSCAPEQMKSH